VDLATNNLQGPPPFGSLNVSMFGLNKTRSKITFEGFRDSYTNYDADIYLGKHYNLLQSNDVIYLKSLIEAFFLNIFIDNDLGGLSPMQNGNQNLSVICTAVNSTHGPIGWQDSQIIMNNF
jgi:hypothetical protein